MTETETEVTMSPAEIADELDRGARKRLGISARSLLAAHAEGKLEPSADVADLLILADLLTDRDKRQLR